MNRLRDLREDRDLTLAQVGADLNLSVQVLSNYEREQRSISVELVHKFCDYYKVTADYLLCRSSVQKPAITEEDAELLAAYHAADPSRREAIDVLLEPIKETMRFPLASGKRDRAI